MVCTMLVPSRKKPENGRAHADFANADTFSPEPSRWMVEHLAFTFCVHKIQRLDLLYK